MEGMTSRQAFLYLFIFLIMFSANSVLAKPYYSQSYDTHRDPFAALQAARVQALTRGVPILIIAGGEWCRWCHIMDRFFKTHADIGKEFYDTFEVLKVYIGTDNRNEKFFAQYPELKGLPHFFIVNTEGTLLESKATNVLEKGSSYDAEAFRRFIQEWAR